MARRKLDEINRQKLEEAERRRLKPIKAFSLNIANFGVNEYSLTEKAREEIRKQAKEIRQFDFRKITVEGHTDSTGSEETNERLSRQRAESVYREFMLNGIPAEKINFVGFGSSMPIDTNATKEGRERNRRTEIFVE